jgi:glycosyltransferase involved in cell wall biosynthesis
MTCGGAAIADCLATRNYVIDSMNRFVVPQREPYSLAEAIKRVLADNVPSDKPRMKGPGALTPRTRERMANFCLEVA